MLALPVIRGSGSEPVFKGFEIFPQPSRLSDRTFTMAYQGARAVWLTQHKRKCEVTPSCCSRGVRATLPS